jgi:molybdopterin converting factor small subunit
VKVEVQLFATLAPYLPPADTDGRSLIDLSTPATVADVLQVLGIPAAMPRIVLVNGHDADESASLAPDDVVAIFPPLAGGA